jgi:anti-sigma-K factor RskA
MTNDGDRADLDLSLLLGADALDATDEFERALVERAVGRDGSAAQELASFAETAALLGWAVSEPPPPALRAQVMAAIDGTRQLPPLLRPGAGRRRRGRPLLVAAVLVLLAAIGGAIVTRQGGGRGDEVAAVLAGADRVVTLVGQGPGEVRIAHGRDDGALTVLARGVPMPDRGSTYQLWLITDDGATHSAGLFSPSSTEGTSTTELGRPADLDLDRLAGLAVTREPSGGSPAPTGEVRYQAPW